MMKKGILLILSLVCYGFSSFAQETEDKKEVEVSEKVLATYVGKYELAPNVILDVTQNKKQLYIQLTGQAKFAVFASSETTFFPKVVEATIDFNKDDEGRVISLTLHQNGRDITCTKVE